MEVANDNAINEKSFSFAEAWAAGSTTSLLDNNNNDNANNNNHNNNNSFPRNRRYTRSVGNRIEALSESVSQDEALLELLTREERAERGLVTAIERRQSHVRTASGEVWVSAMEGECPPLGDNVPFERLYQQVVEPTVPRSASRRPPIMAQSIASQSPVIRRPTRITTRSITDNNIPKTTSVQFDEKSTNSTASVDDKRKAARQLRMRNLVSGSMRKDHISPIQNNITASLLPTHPSTGAVPPSRWHRRNSSRAHFVLDSIQEKELNSMGQIPNGSGVAKQSVNPTVDKTYSNDKILLPKTSRPPGLHRKSLSIGMTERDQLLVDTIVEPDERVIVNNNNDVDDDQKDHLVLPTLKAEQDEDRIGNDELKVTESKESSISFPTKESQAELGEAAPLLDASRKTVLMTQPSFPDSTNGDNTNLSVSDLTPTKMSTSFYRKKRKQQTRFQKLKNFLFMCCHPVFLLQLFYQTFRESHFFLASLPLFITALIFYYGLGNPTFYFLPGEATMAWWLNFIGRQLITLELARLVQYILVDQIILQTRAAVHFLGPFITLLFIQARGWPFVVLTWGILDLFLLHGNHKFQLHWFYFTNIRFYVDGNSGSYILTSSLYLRLLLSMIVAGFASTIKRSLVAVAFGRRTFATFKPRLESILKEVILLSEVAELAEEAFGAANELYQFPVSGTTSRVNMLGSDLNWTRDRFFSRDGGVKLDAHGAEDDLTENSGDESRDSEDDESAGNPFVPNELQESSIRCLRVKDLLDKWEEPVNKMDKSFDTSIRDILKFRRALTFIDDSNPFGDAFGPASSRDQVLLSAEMVYHRLLKLCPECSNLSYDVFDMLIDEEDGKHVNNAKKKALKRIFRPDVNNEISMLVFLQSCDSLYKKLRFFRASVGNASIIDKALEQMLNGIFFFILTLTCLSIMRINPWPLLVSISTLLVSVSFAVGSSASKYIEGIILIAGRRPYDLGDRIYMIDSSNIHADAIASSWFIEDINLSFTTVRYSGTNEVATLSNGAIAGLRIVNANRSPNALICFELPFHISIAADKEKLTALRSALDKYARDFPNHWKCFVLCRVNTIRVEIEQAVLFFSFQHQSSWQDVSRILLAKADLICFIYDLGKSFGINYDELPKRELLYYAGVLKDGVPKNYRRDLTSSENVKGSSDDDPIRPADSFLTNLKQTFR